MKINKKIKKEKTNSEQKKYIFIGKTLFFPKEKILVIGDLHLGYENMLRNQGFSFPLNQFREVESELKVVIEYILKKYKKIEQIVFLGDIKHHFSFEILETRELNRLIEMLKKYVPENKIILIRGNHERNDKNGKYQDYYITKDIAFVHGHQEFIEIYDKKINLIVMGHLHPSITLRDEMKIKNEKYKCFLVGRYQKKDFVIVPSFLSFTEGVAANEMSEIMDNKFSIVPNDKLENFEVFIVQPFDKEPLDFGKLKEIG